MNMRRVIAAIGLALAALLLRPSPVIGQGATTGEILVGFTDTATLDQVETLVSSYGLTWEPSSITMSTAAVSVSLRVTDRNTETYLPHLETNPSISWAQISPPPVGQPAEDRYLAIRFKEGVTETEARSILAEFPALEIIELTIQEPWSPPKWGKVLVPIGEEQRWINEFTRLVWNDPNTIVRYAERNQVFGTLNQDQPDGDLFQPEIGGAPRQPSLFALPLPLVAFFSGGIAVALVVVFILVMFFVIRRKKSLTLPHDDTSQKHHVPFKKVFLILFVALLSLGYLVLFRSPLRLSRIPGDSGETEVVGDVKTFQRFLASQTRRVAGGLLGSRDLCPDDDCSPPRRPEVETEQVTVALTGAQITDLVARFKPQSILIANIQIQFRDGKGYATGTSFYPFLPGVVSVQARASLGKFRLEKAFLGQIPIPESKYALINDGANFLIFDFLEGIGVSVDELDIVGDTIVATAQAPRGLIRIEGDTVVVNVDILTGSTSEGTIEVRTPTVPAPTLTTEDSLCTLPYLQETNITDINHPLVIESRQAILASRVSESYLNRHFKLLCAVADQGSHRLVRWLYWVGEFHTVLVDEIGSDGQQNIHSIGDVLHGFREIEQVISADEAQQMMQACIGDFRNASVGLADGKLSLLAESTSGGYSEGADWIQPGGQLDLETGICTKTESRMIHAPL